MCVFMPLQDRAKTMAARVFIIFETFKIQSLDNLWQDLEGADVSVFGMCTAGPHNNMSVVACSGMMLSTSELCFFERMCVLNHAWLGNGTLNAASWGCVCCQRLSKLCVMAQILLIIGLFVCSWLRLRALIRSNDIFSSFSLRRADRQTYIGLFVSAVL